jgi:hypothetical protein
VISLEQASQDSLYTLMTLDLTPIATHQHQLKHIVSLKLKLKTLSKYLTDGLSQLHKEYQEITLYQSKQMETMNQKFMDHDGTFFVT